MDSGGLESGPGRASCPSRLRVHLAVARRTTRCTTLDQPSRPCAGGLRRPGPSLPQCGLNGRTALLVAAAGSRFRFKLRPESRAAAPGPDSEWYVLQYANASGGQRPGPTRPGVVCQCVVGDNGPLRLPGCWGCVPRGCPSTRPQACPACGCACAFRKHAGSSLGPGLLRSRLGPVGPLTMPARAQRHPRRLATRIPSTATPFLLRAVETACSPLNRPMQTVLCT